MPAFEHSAIIVGSEDQYRPRFVDRKVNQKTGKVEETPVDLTGWTGLKIRVQFNTGTGTAYGAAKELTVSMDADQVNNTGYVYRAWQAGDLNVTPEDYEMRVYVLGADPTLKARISIPLIEQVHVPPTAV